MFCVNCGNSLPDGVNFCAQCGAKTATNNQPSNYQGFAPVNQGYNTPNHFNMGGQKPPQPNSYMAWAILLTIFGFFPFGIVSIIYSSKVSGLYAMGDYEMAKRMSKNALTWIHASWITTATFWFIILLILIISGI